MDFDLLYKMPKFETGMDKSLMQLPIEGSIFRKSYYDPVKRRNISEYISGQDISLPYTTKVDIDESPRKTHILYQRVNDIKVRAKKGIYVASAFELGPGSAAALPIKSEIRDSGDKVQGVSNQSMWWDIPRIILEQHRGWDLDGDGIEEDYVITVDYETRKPLRITDRRFLDWKGDMLTIEHFTHYFLLPNPEGFYGLGFGILLTGLNTAANEIVNEVIDAGYLANMQGGFISRRSGIKRGSLTFKRGEFKEVDTYVDDIQKAIFTFNFQGPNQTLYAALGLLFEYSKLVSSVSETMTGQLPASDTPATTVMALIEEGRKVFSSIHKRIHRSFKDELSKLYRLNSVFLDEKTYFQVLGDSNRPQFNGQGKPIQEEIGRADFSNSLDVVPVSDPNIISRAEKVLKAQQAFQMTMTSPITSNNPNAIFAAQKRFYEALEVQKIDEILPPMPPPPDLPPNEENASFINEKPVQALPTQDHTNHLAIHDELLTGAFGAEISGPAKKIIDGHKREHLSFLYLQQSQQQMMANARALEAMAGAGRL